MKTVGLYTLFNNPNFGCFLQAFATQEFLKDRGYSVTISLPNKRSKRDFIDWKLTGILDNTKQFFSGNLEKHNQGDFLKKRSESYKRDLFYINTTKEKSSFDFLLLGSDEIWNLENNTFYPYLEYFGIGRIDKKKIAYAPTIASCNMQRIFKDIRRTKAIKELNHVFPRDIMTKKLVDNIRNEDSKIVVDPTLLITNWDKYISNIKIERKYLLYYGYFPNKNIVSSIKNLARKNNLLIVTPNFYYPWSDLKLPCGPFSFLDLIRNAEFIITDTFHGTIFSLIFKKNFISIKKSLKVDDFLTRFSGLNYLIDQENINQDKLEKIYFNFLKNNKFEDMLNEARNQSRDLLVNSLV